MVLPLLESPTRLRTLVRLWFFCSGASSLIFETVFTRLLTYTFGNTAQSASTVLAAFLCGLALGAAGFGWWVDRRGASLRLYAILEFLIGLYCIFIPVLFAALTRAYVGLHHRFELGPARLLITRFALASIAILPPTILMGGTLPVLARWLASRQGEFEPEVNQLYGWNTLGAAAGALVSTYLLMPLFGVRATIAVACATNFGIFLSILAIAPAARVIRTQLMPVNKTPSASEPLSEEKWPWIIPLGAFLTGSVALAYEVIWTHVQAFTIGNTVYAFGTMLFTVLCGLGIGAQIVARYFRRPEEWGKYLAASQILLASSVLLTLPLWDRLARIFGSGPQATLDWNLLAVGLLMGLRISYLAATRRGRPASAGWLARLRANEPLIGVAVVLCLAFLIVPALRRHPSTFFASGELLRFFCAFYLLIVPAIALGMSFPLLLSLAARARSRARAGGSVGGIYSLNTLGAILGSVGAGFFLLPRIGSQSSLRLAAAVNLALGLLFAGTLTRARRQQIQMAAAAVALGALLAFAVPVWDPARMIAGSYVYFSRTAPQDRILYLDEDVQGGLTSVSQKGITRTLLTNGKFQGNNTGEVQAQSRFALIPILFTHRFDRALVIGLGTGNTLRTVALFPFEHVDAVELAPRIVTAARGWFGDVNGLVFDRDPRVRLSVNDGRNFLLLSRDPYDLITIEISSIWISGEADLYNREFYELCRAHLGERGVLQQWVQLHHIRTETLLVLLNTAARVFPHVAFFAGPEQGLLVASSGPLECDFARLKQFDEEPAMRNELAKLNLPGLEALLGELLLVDDSYRRATGELPRFGYPRDQISSDFHPILEYATPKGNALPYDTAPINLEFLSRHRPAVLPTGLVNDHNGQSAAQPVPDRIP
jgi:spermidine synthase